ncbi:MAG: hypothetical protein Q8K97_06665 [Pseudohongiella sp.]|nr:hypothetical protein [Pseudohongiella sp.]MDP2127045.1 hypothetical protein [Pseudohongiella sp.]
MHQATIPRLLLAFITALVVATIWGSVVQSQFNLNALAGIGADITPGVRITTTLADVFSGFSPTYAAYVVLPSFLVAFVVAWFISRRLPGQTVLWFAAAGAVAVFIGNPVVNYLSPVALLVGATRDLFCLLLMALGGAVAGALFVSVARHVPLSPRPAPSNNRIQE